MRDSKGWLDKAQQKVVSRKFLVFIMTSIFLVLGFVTSDVWAMIATAYIGIQGFSDIVQRWREVG